MAECSRILRDGSSEAPHIPSNYEAGVIMSAAGTESAQRNALVDAGILRFHQKGKPQGDFGMKRRCGP
jgi:hypothetical protein